MNKTPSLHFRPTIIEALPAWLNRQLPGLEAQLKMAPPNRRERLTPTPPFRHSAVLILLYNHQDELRILFTRRPMTLRHHAGEICFPGGGQEAQDANLWATALRETEEETGIAAHAITALGKLTPLFIAPSRNLVHPFVGWIAQLPCLHPNSTEVEQVLEIPLNAFFDQTNMNTYLWTNQGTQHKAPCFLIQGACIWGATAMMLSELLVILQEHGV